MSKVKSHISKRGNKIVKVRAYVRNTPRSSCINSLGVREDGTKYITLRGVEYDYPELPNNRINGIIRAKSMGRYYNKNIRGKFY